MKWSNHGCNFHFLECKTIWVLSLTASSILVTISHHNLGFELWSTKQPLQLKKKKKKCWVVPQRIGWKTQETAFTSIYFYWTVLDMVYFTSLTIQNFLLSSPFPLQCGKLNPQQFSWELLLSSLLWPSPILLHTTDYLRYTSIKLNFPGFQDKI